MDNFGGHRKTKLLFFFCGGGGGVFLWYFLKVNVQNGNTFLCCSN